MRNLGKITALLLAVLMLNSCVTVFLAKKQKVTFKTSSEDAVIYLDNEKIGEGTSVTKKIEKGTVRNVTIVYGDEYLQKNEVLVPQRKKSPGYYVCQGLNVPFIAVFYGLYAMVLDAKIPKAHKYDKVNSFTAAPQKRPTRSEDSKYIYLSNISLDIEDIEDKILWHSGMINTDLETAVVDAEAASLKAKQKQELKEAKKKKRKKNKEYLVEEKKDLKLEDVIFTGDLQRELYEGGYMDTVNNVFIDNNNTVILEGKISKIDLFKIAPNKTGWAGNIYRARTEMKWYIKNTYGEIVDSISDQSVSEHFAYSDDIIKKTVGNSVTQSFNTLFAKKAFKENYKIVTDFNAGLEASKLNMPNSRVKDKRDAVQASVIVKTENGHGSGFAITNDGYIVTNYHVLIDRNKGTRVKDITVIDSEGNEMKGTLEKYNKFRDVALIKVDSKFKKAFYPASEKSFRVMDDVYTIGAPKSITLGQSIAIGLISNERKVNNNDLIQLNMSINSGNSGGPIFDGKGRLHGVVVSKLIGENTEGVSFAIPSYKLADYLNLQF